MRITCNTIEEFLSNIIDDVKLFENTIWVSVSKSPLDGNDRNSARFEVSFQASAVIIFPEGGESLLDLGIDCGKDYHDVSQEFLGSEEASEHKDKLKSFCDGRDLVLRPGVVSV